MSMGKIITTIKAIVTRIIFSAHSFIAVWQVTKNSNNQIFWVLCSPIGLLVLEGIFTLAIKKNQEWRWFCPSVFLYLGSVVPAIWLLELDKIERRIGSDRPDIRNFTAIGSDLKKLGVNINIPNIQVDNQTLTTLIEQFLMLILIVGRWLLPKGDLTRDQLSQLLLVYIGTAADIIEFFDSYKDDSIAKEPLLVFLTLGIWSWSLMQFTIVLSATRSRKPRGGGSCMQEEATDCCNNCCCSIDVWGIALNVILQDAPFLTFRLLIIVHYKIINYMNVFFTCKNTLVILLQMYRLYVVNAEHWHSKRELKKSTQKNKRIVKGKKYDDDFDDRTQDIYIISGGRNQERRKPKKISKRDDDSVDDGQRKVKSKKHKKRARKDTGYSTASSQNLHRINRSKEDKFRSNKHDKRKSKHSKRMESSGNDSDSDNKCRKKVKKSRQPESKQSNKDRQFDAVMEESDTSESSSRYEVVNEKISKKSRRNKSTSSSSSSTSSSTSSSSD